MAGAYPRFCTAGWDATVVLRRVIPSTVMSPVPIYIPGWRERQCGVKFLVQGNNTRAETESAESKVKLLLLLKNSCIISGMGREWDDRMWGIGKPAEKLRLL